MTKITDHLYGPSGGWDQYGTPCIWCKQPREIHEREIPPPTARDRLMPIMFWGNAFERPEADRGSVLLVDLALALFASIKPTGLDPKTCVRADIPRKRRELAAGLLASGKVIETYLGDAQCRICGETLGNKDLGGWSHLWPEKAEHYVLEHDVWVPGLDRIIERSEN